MKKKRWMLALFFSCLLLTACGGREDDQDGGGSRWRGIRTDMEDQSAIMERTEYYDIFAASEPVFLWEEGKEGSPLSAKPARLIGMQFYQDEPAQIWSERVPYGFTWNICLHRQDGSREVLLAGIGDPSVCGGYLDREGNLYWWKRISFAENGQITANASLKKYLASGETVFDRQMEPGQEVMDIRQTADGRMYLVIQEKEIQGKETKNQWLAELDPDNGTIRKLCGGQPMPEMVSSGNFGIWGNKPIFWSGKEIAETDTDSGSGSCVFSFRGTSYVMPKGYLLQDFRIMDDESLEVLWATSDGSKSLWEKMRMEKVQKTPIVLRGVFTDSWLAERIFSFNQSSQTYHVMVEVSGDDPEDFARLTSVQIATGKGPDILCGNLIQDYISGMMEKGALEDLRPYMEDSGICQGDYFPFVFDIWKDGEGIYGVNPGTPALIGYLMDSGVLGGTREPDIGALVDVLLARQEDAVFLDGYGPQELLAVLLKGTDTLWGMVDWEKGSCDFSGELFAGILETARRYGDRGIEGKPCLAKMRLLNRIYLFEDLAEREREGKVICGVLFDEGCHAAVKANCTLAVNANSCNKEGAWEFIAYLLGEGAQSPGSGIPAHRKAFEIWVEGQKEQFADGKKINVKFADQHEVVTGVRVYTEEDVTDEIIEEFTRTLEDARPYPLRTAPILDIIGEEAADYFNGSKSAEEVARLVTNRVQTYLDEGR